MMSDDEPVGLQCPRCGQAPMAVMAGGQQAFCGNHECDVLNWNPTKTRAELDAGTSEVRFDP